MPKASGLMTASFWGTAGWPYWIWMPGLRSLFHSACGRYVVVFNGEIYNFTALKPALVARGVVFRTTSDTEVLVELFKAEGEAMLPKLHGMFAFVIWDRQTRRAFAARDPYGIKPLYLAAVAGGVLLASQVKALMATGMVSRSPDLKGQAGFWMLGSVPEPHTWYADVQAVPAGGCVWIADGNKTASRRSTGPGSPDACGPPSPGSASPTIRSTPRSWRSAPAA